MAKKKTTAPEGPSLETLHKMECKLCPLNNAPVRHPKIPPSGVEDPIVYMLGEAPGKEEDYKGVQFVGRSGSLLRKEIPAEFEDYVRWNNVVRTWPGPGNPTPGETERECCRPSVERDIAAAKPKAIFGFGSVPMEWVGQNGIGIWRGRRMPVKINGHSCWFYFFHHPAYILRVKDERHSEPPGIEIERAFKFDLKRAFAEVESLPPAVVHTPQMVKARVEWVTGKEPGALRKVLDFLKRAGTREYAGVDYETQNIRPYSDDSLLLTKAVSTEEDGTLAWPYEHAEAGWSDSDFKQLTAGWIEFCKAPVKKVSHFLGFEMEWTAFYFGKELLRASRWEDSASQAYILDERKGKGKPGAFALEFLCQEHFGFNLKALSPKMNKKKMSEVPLADMLPYNAWDAKYHRLLFLSQQARLTGKLAVAYEVKLRQKATVVLTQMKGLPVDQKLVKHFEEKYTKEIERLTKKIHELKVVKHFKDKFNKEFNHKSHPQMKIMFQDLLRCKEGIYWHKGQEKYTCDEEMLSKVDHPLAQLIVKIRKVEKLLSTYVLPLKEDHKNTLLFPDKLLHPILNTTFTVTGRLSSEDPNEQNFPSPKRSGTMGEVRRQVVAPPGHLICALDLAQIEARVIAMASQDEYLTASFWNDEDIHMEWTEEIAYAYPARVGGKQYLKDKKIIKEFRTDVKNQWTFPLFFGAALESAAGYLNVPVDVLKPLYEKFWSRFPGVLNWQQKIIKFYRDYGYVETLTGRRRRGPMSENELINDPIQGTTADIVMDSMNRISVAAEKNWWLQPHLNVHDDLTFIFPEDKVDVYCEYVIGQMLKKTFPFINVPLGVELAIGENWCDLEEVGKFYSHKWFKNS